MCDASVTTCDDDGYPYGRGARLGDAASGCGGPEGGQILDGVGADGQDLKRLIGINELIRADVVLTAELLWVLAGVVSGLVVVGIGLGGIMCLDDKGDRVAVSRVLAGVAGELFRRQGDLLATGSECLAAAEQLARAWGTPGYRAALRGRVAAVGDDCGGAAEHADAEEDHQEADQLPARKPAWVDLHVRSLIVSTAGGGAGSNRDP